MFRLPLRQAFGSTPALIRLCSPVLKAPSRLASLICCFRRTCYFGVDVFRTAVHISAVVCAAAELGERSLKRKALAAATGDKDVRE